MIEQAHQQQPELSIERLCPPCQANEVPMAESE
jgi:hypothetical protein